LDHAGIATVSITQAPSITRHARPSLAVFVAHPFGLTLGAVGDDATHLAVARTVLAEAERGTRQGRSWRPASGGRMTCGPGSCASRPTERV
jgi:hypothetical protein